MNPRTPLLSLRAAGAILVVIAALTLPALYLVHAFDPRLAAETAEVIVAVLRVATLGTGAVGVLLLVIYPPSWPLLRRFFALQRARLRFDRLAMAELIQRVRQFPNATDLLKLGRMLADVGKYLEALHPINLALQADQAHLPARFALGTTLLRIGKAGEAAAHLSVVAAREPSHAYHEVQLRLAEALVRAGRPELAVSPLDQFERETGGSPESGYWKGLCFRALGRNQEARDALAASVARAKSLGRRCSTDDRIAAARSRWLLMTRVG
jgi:tetratricopeptide (TPR) repeat protein